MPFHIDPKRDRAWLSRASKLARGVAEPLPDPTPPKPKTTTTTRKPSPVERIAAAGYMVSQEQGGRHWFENKDGARTPEGADYAEARRLALAHIGET